MDTALVLGVVGTVLSAFALGWNVFRDVLDDGRLRVRCYFGEVHGDGVRQDNVLLWSVTNTGRRPVVVQHVGGEQTRNPRYFVLVRSLGSALPQRLEPGQFAQFWIDRFDQLPATDDVRAFHAMDTLGRCFRAKRAEVEAVRQRLRQLRAGQVQAKREEA